MIDIHCHILPAIDDGSGNLSDSIEMAEIAAGSDIRGIIATPHCNIPGIFENYKSAQLKSRFAELRDALKKKGIPVEIYTGQEVFLSRRFAEHLENGDFITLNNSRYMLVEFDFRTDFAFAAGSVEYLTSKGYVPVVAHPERYGFIIEEPVLAARLKAAGALVQVNRGSLTAEFGPYVMRTAQHLIENRLADFVASDAHSQYSRTPSLAQAHELISENYSYDYAELLLRINPAKVIADEII